LNINNGVESRYAVEGNTGLDFIFQEGDMVGANLIDAYDPNEKDPAKWDIVPYVAPSLPFKYTSNNEWKSDAELGIGNYLFTFPFNPKDNGRAAAQFELPRIQQYNGEDLNQIIADNNKAVGAVVLYEGQTEAKVSLKNLYTYPKFILNFDNGEKINKITKVVLKYSDKVIYKGGFHHADVAEMFNAETIENWLKLSANKGKTEEDYWAEKTTKDFIIDEDDADYAQVKDFGMPQESDYLIVEMGENVKLESNTSNKYAEIRLMMPSVDDFYNTGITMYVVTDNGTYKKALNANACTFKGTTPTEKITTALARSKSNTITVSAKGWVAGTDLGNIVTTADDWNDLVAVYGDSKKYAAVGGTADFNVSILSDDFALTSDLKMPKVAEFIINTPISVEGEVTLNNIKVTDVLTVEKGATLTTSATFVAEEVEVEEGANLVFAEKFNSNNKVVEYDGVEVVKNYGTVTVPAGVIAGFELHNLKKGSVLNVEAAASRAATEAGVVYLTGINQGTINNNGIINVIDHPQWNGTDFENKAVNADYGYEQDEDGIWDGQPTVNNKGEFNANAYAINNGLFVNEGVLSSNFTGSSKFYNYNELDVKAEAYTFIDSNEGTIVLAETDPADFTIYTAGKEGTIKYTAGKKAVDLSTSPVNYLIAAGDVTISKTFIDTKGTTATTDDVVTALPTLEMIAGGSITVTKDAAKLTNLIITAGKCSVANEFTVANVTIAEDASLTIPAEGKFHVSSSTIADGIEGEGNLYVNGTLNFTSVKNDTPANSLPENVTVGKLGKVTAKAEDKEYVENVVDDMVQAWWAAVIKPGSTLFGTAYFTTNPYDVNAFAKFIYEASTNNWTETETALALIGEDGWDLISTEQTQAGITKALIADYDRFEAAVDRYIIAYTADATADATFQKTYIDEETGAFESTYAAKVTNVDDLYYTQEMAMRDLRAKLVGATTLAQFNSTKSIYKVITDAELTTALSKQASKATGACAYIWAENTCPLYHVATAAAKYSPNDWDLKWDIEVFSVNDKFDNLATVQSWVKYADMKGATTEATVAANYVETAPTWEYTAEQVKAAFGAVKVVIEVTVAP